MATSVRTVHRSSSVFIFLTRPRVRAAIRLLRHPSRPNCRRTGCSGVAAHPPLPASLTKTCRNLELTLEAVEGLLDLLAGLLRGGNQRQARRSAVVSVQIHRVLESGNAVLGCDHLRGALDAVLPVERGRGFARPVRLPNAERCV